MPEVGRYNAGQSPSICSPACACSCCCSRAANLARVFHRVFAVDITRLASLLHAIFAFVLILTIVVHIYAGIWVKGSVRAMMRGTVTYGWAWKHHRAWFRDVTRNAARK